MSHSHNHKDIIRRFTQLTLKEVDPLPIKKICPPAPRVHHSPIFCWSNTHPTWNTVDTAGKAYKERIHT